MQQIERVGVIALLLMVVTIVVVALWDDDAESSNQAQTQVEEQEERSGAQRLEVAAAERARSTDGLRSTRASARQRTTAPIGSGSSAMRGEGSARPARSDRNSTPREDPARLRESERPRRSEVALSIPDPQPEPRTQPAPRGEPARTTRGPVAEGIEFGTRRRNETRKPPRTTAGAQPVSTVRPDPKPAQEPAADGAAVYIVASGDSLERIARKMLGKGSRWPELQALNGGVDPLKLHVGMKLKLPSAAQPTPGTGRTALEPAADPKPAAPAQASQRTYVVQPGDILGRIAQRELGSAKLWHQIVELNPKVNPDRLLVGARLVLPDVAQAPTAREPRNLVAQADRSVDSTYRVR